MIYIYRLLINITIILSPIIIVIRLIKKKEDLKRFIEKFTLFSKKRKIGKLIWFHTVSVGELLSIIPLINNLEKNKKINQILVTSSTLSSAKLFTKFNFKKTIHQFFPIDNNFLTKRFLSYWKPSLAIFIDSEIWPNMLLNLKKANIKKILLNARISKKSYNKWKILGSFSEKLFQIFNFTYPQNSETKNYLKKFKVKKIKFLGNLKYSQNKNKLNNLTTNQKKFFNKKDIWCAASTHPGEEKICVQTHLKLVKKFKNLVTIIIPRHTNRSQDLYNEFSKSKIIVHLHSSKKKIKKNTQIYIVDTYGETEKFFDICKVVFIGKSLLSAGGQNPLEPARYNCKIIHGPKISNFKEIYKLLNNQKIAFKINNQNQLFNKVYKFISKNSFSKIIKNKITIMGNKILEKNLNEINFLIKQ